MPYKIVFFDIDGTLVDEDKQIPNDALEAVQKLKKQNIEVVLATGRASYFFHHIAKKLGIDSYVSLNGSYVVYRGKTISEHVIPKARLESLVKMANENRHPLVFEGSAACYADHNQHPHVIESFASLKVDTPAHLANYWKENKIHQVLLHCQSHEEQQYKQSFSELRFVRWHRVSMDVIPDGGSKARGIQAVLQHLGISPADAVAFGDGLNDKEMLSFVGMGIAMGNAHEKVKPYAKFLTKDVKSGGIRYGLQKAGLL